MSGVGPHDELSETVNEIIVDSKRISPAICVCTCKVYVTDSKNVKSDVAVLLNKLSP